MALIFADSFDHYGDIEANLLKGPAAYSYVESTTYVQLETGIKRTGSGSLRITYANSGSNDYLRKSFVVGNNETILGFGLYLPNLPTTDKKLVFSILSVLSPICSINFTPAGAIGIYLGSPSGTLIAQTDNIISAGTFNYIELRVLQDTIVGEVEVRVNGVSVSISTNINTGSAALDGFKIDSAVGGGTSHLAYIDDIYIVDTSGTTNNDFLGPVRVNTVFAISDTAEADWSKNTGSDGYALIDEVPPDADTTYIQASLLGDRSEFGIGTLPPEVITVAGVFIPTMARLSDAGIGNITTSLVSGASVSNGPDTPVTTNYAYYGSIHELNPDGNVPWTKASFEAAKIRVEKTL